MYPVTQIPPDKMKLTNFAWFPNIRPVDKNDIFVWRGKGDKYELKEIKRNAPPLQKLGKSTTEETLKETPKETPKEETVTEEISVEPASEEPTTEEQHE